MRPGDATEDRIKESGKSLLPVFGDAAPTDRAEKSLRCRPRREFYLEDVLRLVQVRLFIAIGHKIPGIALDDVVLSLMDLDIDPATGAKLPQKFTFLAVRFREHAATVPANSFLSFGRLRFGEWIFKQDGVRDAADCLLTRVYSHFQFLHSSDT